MSSLKDRLILSCPLARGQTKDCGLPSFSCSPPVPQDPVILCTMTIRLTALFICRSLNIKPGTNPEHISAVNLRKTRSCADTIWGRKLFVFSGIKGDLQEHINKDGAGCLCSFATVTTIHLASRWAWHHNNEHKELLTDSEHQQHAMLH